MLILKLLDGADMYGYEMISTLKLRSQNVFELKAGTLYPLLHSLVKKKYLTCYEKQDSGKTRKYYTLTTHGKKLLAEKEEMWRTYENAVTAVLGGV